MNTTPIGIAVLLAFALGFTAICIWAYWPANRQTFRAYGNIPFQEDEDHGE